VTRVVIGQTWNIGRADRLSAGDNVALHRVGANVGKALGSIE